MAIACLPIALAMLTEYQLVYVYTRGSQCTCVPFSNQKVVTQHYKYVRTVPREALQALVHVQAHMLARIVVEIRAADIAVELEPQL